MKTLKYSKKVTKYFQWKTALSRAHCFGLSDSMGFTLFIVLDYFRTL